jgi:hypothetical protein
MLTDKGSVGHEGRRANLLGTNDGYPKEETHDCILIHLRVLPYKI